MNSRKTNEGRKKVGIQEKPAVTLADYVVIVNNSSIIYSRVQR